MKKLLKRIPKPIITIAVYTSILYFGRGFAEAYLPVFLSFFTNSFAETGVLKSIYDIVFFIIAPIVGYFADRISAKKLILLGLCFYPLIAISYYFAGITYLAIFIVISRVLNGIAYSFISISRDKYIYKHGKGKVARSMGFFDSITHRSWIIAVAISIIFVKWVPIHILILGIIPASVIALFIAKRLPDTERQKTKINFNLKTYLNIFKGIKNRNPKLRKMIRLGMLISMVSSAFYFFLPIEIYQQGYSLVRIGVVGIVDAIPESMEIRIGKRIDKDHGRPFIISSMIIILVFAASIRLTTYVRYLIAMLIVGIALNFLRLELDKQIANKGDEKYYGEINGIKGAFNEGLGIIIGPIIMGILMDIGGMPLLLTGLISLMIATVSIFIIHIFQLPKRNA